MSSPREPIDVSDLLKPGVYLLSWRGKVVFVGRAKCLLTTINDHRTANGTARLPEWFPIKRVQFDGFSIIPISYDQTLALVEALTDYHQLRRPSAIEPASPAARHPFDAPPHPTVTRRL